MNLTHSPPSTRITALLLADLGFFGFTSPRQVPAILLIVGFLLLVATLYVVISAVARLLALQFPDRGPSVRRMARLLTAASAFLLGMQSVGQLTVRDMAAFLPLIVLGYAYYSYTQRSSAA